MTLNVFYITLLCLVTKSNHQFLFKEQNQIDNFIKILSSLNPSKTFRLANKEPKKKWFDRNLPYVISERFSDNNKLLIEKSINRFQNTCIEFKPKRTENKDYVYIRPGIGCNSSVGRQGGEQNVTLGEGCLNLNTIVHELMHSIGFLHEHQRYDREMYIKINKQNVKTGMEYEFIIREQNETMDLDFEYDYNSVMQYEETAFSKNGRPTMESRVKGIKLGPNDGLSQTDIQRINKYYGCVDHSLDKNNQTVKVLDSKIKCAHLKWIAFDGNQSQQIKLVVGGFDTYGNRFFICRTSVDNQIIAGHMFEGMCYVIKNGRELEIKEFQVLTHSMNGYKWHKLLSNQLPINSIITENDLIIDKNSDKYPIGRCLIEYNDYKSQVIGTIRTNKKQIRQLFVPFNGLEVVCNQFEILLCLPSK